MSYLLDTCVVSELAKPEPDAGVLRWMSEADETGFYLSVLSVGELEKGLTKLAASARRRKIEKWLRQDLLQRFGDRLLAIDQSTAERWGRLSGESEARGRPLPVIDALMAATALVHGFELVTRNTADLQRCGARCVNPWGRASTS